MTGDVLVERDGPTALLTFNRPDARNTLTFEMYETLRDACAQLEELADVGAAREGPITGAPQEAFLEKRKPDWQGR